MGSILRSIGPVVGVKSGWAKSSQKLGGRLDRAVSVCPRHEGGVRGARAAGGTIWGAGPNRNRSRRKKTHGWTGQRVRAAPRLKGTQKPSRGVNTFGASRQINDQPRSLGAPVPFSGEGLFLYSASFIPFMPSRARMTRLSYLRPCVEEHSFGRHALGPQG